MDLYNEKFGAFEVKFWNENGEDVATVYRNGRELLTIANGDVGDAADLFERIAEKLLK